MTDKKLTALTDTGTLANTDTGAKIYVVTDGGSRQAHLGSLYGLASGDTGALATLTDNQFAAQWREHNLIVNSHFQVSQENGTTQGSHAPGSNAAYYMADQWSCITDEMDDTTITYDLDEAHPMKTAYPFIERAIKVSSSVAAESAIAANEYVATTQSIEGLRVKGLLQWGAASGNDLQIGFLCRANYSGNICVSVRNNALDASYVQEQAITADTDTWVSMTFPAWDATGTAFLETSGIGLRITVCLVAGTNFQGTADQWNNANDFGTSTLGTDFVGATGRSFWLGPMLVFPEGIPMPSDANNLHFFQRPYERDLVDCQRYYYKDDGYGYGAGSCFSTTVGHINFVLPVEMRAAPTLGTSGTIGDFHLFHTGGSTALTVLAVGKTGTRQMRLNATVAAGLTAGNACVLNDTTTTTFLDFNARM